MQKKGAVMQTAAEDSCTYLYDQSCKESGAHSPACDIGAEVVIVFFLLMAACRWIQKRQQDEDHGAAATEAIDQLPGVRLVADQAFVKRLTASVIFCLVASPVCTSSPSPLAL
eukprot:scaffold53248_cov16-Prasinocladus_malaysianus.AAC.1